MKCSVVMRSSQKLREKCVLITIIRQSPARYGTLGTAEGSTAQLEAAESDVKTRAPRLHEAGNPISQAFCEID